MRLAFVLLALMMGATGTAALATEWRAGMVEDEGGPVMNASVSAFEGVEAPELRLYCGDGQQLGLRYVFGTDLSETAQLPTDGPIDFTFKSEEASAVVPLQYEEMDGAYATSVAADAPVIALIRAGRTLTIDDPTGQYHPVDFPLTGSGKAISALLATCS